MEKWISNKYGVCKLNSQKKLDNYFIKNSKYQERIYQEDDKMKIRFRKGVIEIYYDDVVNCYYFIIKKAVSPDCISMYSLRSVVATIKKLEETVEQLKKEKSW